MILEKDQELEVELKNYHKRFPAIVGALTSLVVSSVGVDFKSVAKRRLFSESRANLMSAWRHSTQCRRIANILKPHYASILVWAALRFRWVKLSPFPF